ncbi:MAG: 4-hydroxy-3-methylbut-2-enyl diphosphate reductase, partial [Candidatus Omnitrophica bacterium]|nr:4-hydroxy-3-methylbut-2-enyl diphosphate reductase [Candidatus Omnitrophota bacterium]
MKITVARSAGFCFGVKRALQIAADTALSTRNVYMLGDIVHNETVVRDMTASGIKKTGRITKGGHKTLLIRAHGAPAAIYLKARRMGNRIIDATCPMVKEIHRIARQAEKKGYPVIIIGDKEHDEVRGIIGQLEKKALVIDSSKALPLEAVRKLKKAAIVVQSTQNLEKALSIVNRLKAYISDIKFFNTICYPTRTKQNEIRSLPLSNDVMVIIG